MVGVDEHADVIGRRQHVAPGEQAFDAIGVGIEGAHEDVQIALVVGDSRFRAEAGRRVLHRVPLAEGRKRLGRPPDVVVVAAVDHRWVGGPQRHRRGRGDRGQPIARGLGGTLDGGRRRSQRQDYEHDVIPGEVA